MVQKSSISVAGIAGPGDPFAEPEATMETLRLIREKYPKIILCVSTNGLNISPYIPELEKIGVSHVTITVNTINESIGARIYNWIKVKKRIFRGIEGATLLLENQLAAIASLKDHGITVKINSIVIPGINDRHIVDIAKELSKRDADIHNCIPLIPVKGSLFENLLEPNHNTMSGIKAAASAYLPQMKHCQRCRADAAGMITEKNPNYWDKELSDAASKPLNPQEKRPYIGVTTREGILVNQHLGEAKEIAIYTFKDEEAVLIEKRKTSKPGKGDNRWKELSNTLSDCKALLVNGIGNNPQKILEKSGIKINLIEGFISEAVYRVFQGESLDPMSCRMKECGAACTGKGNGCG
jgi:nitrogen fixation protein NifB